VDCRFGRRSPVLRPSSLHSVSQIPLVLLFYCLLLSSSSAPARRDAKSRRRYFTQARRIGSRQKVSKQPSFPARSQLTTFLHTVPVKKVLWGDDLYAREPDEESEMAWTRLLPLGRGQVKINNQSAIPDLPGYNQTGTEEDGLDLDNTAWVTVFHQLHCLVRPHPSEVYHTV